MKRIGHIIDRITLDDVRREVVDTLSTRRYRRPSAVAFLRDFDERGPRLLVLIRSGQWTPAPVVPLDIVENGKARHIEIPSFVDMIVQRVLIRGRLEKAFLDHTWPHAFSSIKNRGPLKAARHVSRLINRGRSARWCLYCDVRKYYAHINRDIAAADVARIVKDPVALKYVVAAVHMGERGLAIGNTGSHLIANLYLSPVARAVRALPGVSDFVTYMDNIFVFGSSKAKLHAARKELACLLAARGLEMKSDWQIYRTDLRDTKIGGFRVRAGKPWRIYRKTFNHLKQSLRSFAAQPTLHNARSVASLQGWVSSARCQSWRRNHILPVWGKIRKVLRNEDRKSS